MLSSRSLTRTTAGRSSRRARISSSARWSPVEIAVPALKVSRHGLRGGSGRPPPVLERDTEEAHERPQLGGVGARRQCHVGGIREEDEPVPAVRVREPVERREDPVVRLRRDARRHVEHDERGRVGGCEGRRGPVDPKRGDEEPGGRSEHRDECDQLDDPGPARGAPKAPRVRERDGARGHGRSLSARSARPPTAAASGWGRDQATLSAFVARPSPTRVLATRPRSPAARRRSGLPRPCDSRRSRTARSYSSASVRQHGRRHGAPSRRGRRRPGRAAPQRLRRARRGRSAAARSRQEGSRSVAGTPDRGPRRRRQGRAARRRSTPWARRSCVRRRRRARQGAARRGSRARKRTRDRGRRAAG